MADYRHTELFYPETGQNEDINDRPTPSFLTISKVENVRRVLEEPPRVEKESKSQGIPSELCNMKNEILKYVEMNNLDQIRSLDVSYDNIELISKDVCSYYNDTICHQDNNHISPVLHSFFNNSDQKENHHSFDGASLLDDTNNPLIEIHNYNNLKVADGDPREDFLLSCDPKYEISYKKKQKLHGKRCTYCKFCGKECSSSNIKSHLRRHTGEKPYKCTFPQCAKAFADKGNLNTHMRIHTGDRPFKCDVRDCKSSFRAQSHLNDHFKAHFDVRPHVCNICDRTFTRSNTLNTHKRIHTGEKPYQCRYCDQKFTESGNLKMHLVTHSETRPYKCPFDSCDKTFKRKSNLKEHMLTKMHQNQYEQLVKTDEIRKYDDIFGDLKKNKIRRISTDFFSASTANNSRRTSLNVSKLIFKEEDNSTCSNTPGASFHDNIPSKIIKRISEFVLENINLERKD